MGEGFRAEEEDGGDEGVGGGEGRVWEGMGGGFGFDGLEGSGEVCVGGFGADELSDGASGGGVRGFYREEGNG